MSLSRETLSALDPYTRACALVGDYLGHFALMESGLDSALGELLGLRPLQLATVARNMDFSHKVYALRTMIEISLWSEGSKLYKRIAKDAVDCSTVRNVIAHTPFAQSSISDGVTFLVVRARGKFEAIEDDWPIERFASEISKVESVGKAMRGIHQRLSNQRIAELLVNAHPSPCNRPA